MFQSFTGNSRRPRQVNLSGRNANPFAKAGTPQGTSNTVVSAQQSRLERQQDRARVQAATSIQRLWRGYIARQELRQAGRHDWEQAEDGLANAFTLGSSFDAYPTPAVARDQLSRLLRFFDVKSEADQEKLVLIHHRLIKGIEQDRAGYTGGPWPSAYLRLQNTALIGIERANNPQTVRLFLELIQFTVRVIPEITTENAGRYYVVLQRALDKTQIPVEVLAAPLQVLTPSAEGAYQAFGTFILTVPELQEKIGCEPGPTTALHQLSKKTNSRLLTRSLRHSLDNSGGAAAMLLYSSPQKVALRSFQDLAHKCAWLASYIVYFHRQTLDFDHPERYIAEPDLLETLCSLLTVVADGMTSDTTGAINEADPSSGLFRSGFDSFVVEQLDSLVNQRSISSLVSRMSAASSQSNDDILNLAPSGTSKSLATYILTLLRLFPNRGDDIRMWLYVGSSVSSTDHNVAKEHSAIRFFWHASRQTSIFQKVVGDSRAALNLLKPRTSATPAQLKRDRQTKSEAQTVEDEWQIILLFIEMYSFILKVMDDEEFFSFGDERVAASIVFGRNNNLRRDEIMSLSTFLKHLGFTMNYNAADILGTKEDESSQELSSLFQTPARQADRMDRINHRDQPAVVGGVDLDYIKGAVTGLLRAIYERDSRQPFTPKDHWLMTARFDMTSFVSQVVDEEERRRQVRDMEEEEDGDEGDDHFDVTQPSGLVGTGHARHLQRLSDLARKNARESRRRHLQRVAPRLEILQNMPFLIPFTTRVQIFRRFVFNDQQKRRHGVTDPESWRLSQMHSFSGHGLERHHARVRRDHEFEDAFAQFYDLGQSLKEPIHITFLDQFGQEEAGIDGGGVTKEFLTSVTNQAFSKQEGVRLFVENEHHFLFPNPSALDEERELLKAAGLKETSEDFHSRISDMLRQYEFLGRIIGKCLYEGILVDIGFAGFFLLKWALTGGTGSAPKESAYRANINDLREFDEELYQGLLKLKNYAGDVEDFALNFTVADVVQLPPGLTGRSEKVITRELRPGGNDMTVTNSNRLVYISYMTRHRLTSQPYRQTSAFLKGLGSMISPSWLSMFNQQELQTLVGGAAAAINVSDLRAYTSYGGVYVIGDDGQEHPSVQLFWQVMESLPDEDRRKVLKFVTSTPRAPLLGFGSLNPRFSIRDSGGDDTRLPSTSTCVNLLKLPRYRSLEACRIKLLQAVNAGAGFDLS